MITHEEIVLARRVTEFWMDVAIDGDESACWPWLGYEEDGYGRFYFDGRMMGAHELALTFSTGERRLERLDTCHSCNNPICCNPHHLRFGTRQSNVDDMVAAGTARNGSTRLTESDVVTLRERYANGAPQAILSRDFRVSGSLISAIVRGRRWPNAGGPIITERKYNRDGK
jgi:hypothetical protein